ncbi:MAG: hypothetical protein FJ291_03075 [Planctomycetes bacterium]|nr:hypothetical protein [Planctomycetota bacterium]
MTSLQVGVKWVALLPLLIPGLPAFGGERSGTPSRAAAWLLGDGVQPIADLVNAAEPGKLPAFRDRLGSFKAEARERALLVTGSFPEANVWRFDLTTADGQFDVRRLYVEHGGVAFPDPNSVQTRRIGKLLGDPAKGLTHTGPWEIFNGDWLVPTARVALDGQHVYTSWFDLPSLEDQAAGRVYASFALDIPKPGQHAIRIAFDDFARHTRWRPGARQKEKPEITHVPNPLRPHHIGSIAIGIDERVRSLQRITLKPELAGKHPRLSSQKPFEPDDKAVQSLIFTLDPERAAPWEYSDDAESMASDNDMDAGKRGLAACEAYDRLVPRLSPDARKELDRHFLKRFGGFYTFSVFQRNYHPTGYAQNHCSKAIWALLGAGLAWDGPEAQKWLDWAVMVVSKRVELLGRDGGLEWMNESRDYGLGFWETCRKLILQCTGLDLAKGPFFDNEWRYALHNAPAWPKGRVPALMAGQGLREQGNLPLPDGVIAADTPTNARFSDVDQVFMRSGWGDDALRVRLLAGSVFGKEGTSRALRFNWAHCQVNRGSIAIWKGVHPIINEPGADRTYRKSAANDNCIIVNDTDQWGGGQVWHPRLRLDQVGRIAFFADGKLLSVARADLTNAYPPEARIKSLSRVLIHLKPDHFLVFDRLETNGPGKAEWRFHAPFVQPLAGANTFAAFGFHRRSGRPTTYDAAFTKLPDAACQLAFLTPGVKPEIGVSDVYYRGDPFRQPTRHLRVIQESDAPMTLLTAFAPKLLLEAKGKGVFVARAGDLSWTILVGGGTCDTLTSDAHLALAARSLRTGSAELFRFGGRRLEFAGRTFPGDGEDLFAAAQEAKPTPVGPSVE